MTTTTSKNVGGTSKPVETPATAKPQSDEHKAAQVAAHEAAQKPSEQKPDMEQQAQQPDYGRGWGEPASDKAETATETVASNDAAAKARYAAEAKEKAAAEAKEKPSTEAQAEGSTEKAATRKPIAKGGKTSIIIKGKGTMPILADGAMRRVKRGVPIEVSEAELAYIEGNGVALA